MKIKKMVWSPKRGGSLLNGNGISSSDAQSDSSSSLSKRKKTKTRKLKLFRKRSTKAMEDDTGYESDGSAGSTRSTSSSFLQYQNKFFKLKAVLEKRGDGKEKPLESKRLTLFDRIYTRQNEVRKNGDDDYASDDSDEDMSGPPDIIGEEIICSELVDDDGPGAAIQESGEATAEGQSILNEAPPSPPQYPTQELNKTLPAVTTEQQQQQQEVIDPTPLRSQHKKKDKKKRRPPNTDAKEPVPLSIPRTISYALRSAISDGSKRERNSHSLMERRAFRPNGSHIDASYWSHRGRRAYMEDRYVIEYLGTTSKQAKNPKPITFLAVYDGHGGAEASQFCSDWLSSYVRKDKEYPINISNAMKSAFTKIDKDFVASGYLAGSTVCACAVIGDEAGYEKIICANAGDSRAIVVKKNGSFVALSDDHKPDRNDETKRINDLGGKVIHWGRWRVEGVLAVSRSVGDARLKPYVTAEPDVVEYTLEDDDMFLVIASDGVWDTMSSDLVAKFTLVNSCKIVDKRLEVDDSLLRWIARQISKRARENGSSDNTSVIVANLQRKT